MPKNLKILLDNCTGHVTIARMLPYWKKMGHEVSESPIKCNVHLAYVRFGIQTSLPKILRLDGIYYDSDTNFNGRNIGISDAHSRADGIIYQSCHSMSMCEKYLSPRRKIVNPVIIHNGIPENWCGTPLEHDGINISVANKWRRHKRLQEIIQLFTTFQKDFPNSTLHVFGNLHDNIKVVHPKIKYYGHVDRSLLIDTYRKTDFTLHLSKRDCSPNSVVEYLGAGIPVITTDNCGGSTEMCRMTDGCSVIKGDDDYYNLEPVPHYRDSWNDLPVKVSEGILNAMKELATEKKKVILPKVLTAEHMAKTYIKYMMEIV
jgi:glycosyltransferase involved in cell wall biosynthesis